MDEMIDLLRRILSEMEAINRKLDDIKGAGIYDSIADVCDKLDNVQSSVDAISHSGTYTLRDIVFKD